MTDRDLAAWLEHAERLHPRTIDLTLTRIDAVLARLGLREPPFQVITVGGTNGKGSCVAFLEAMLLAAGRRVGAYTSPHLQRYTERIRVAGVELAPESLARSFAAVEAARGEIALTYFEFGTAVALDAFRASGVEVAVLEVGLGGRLDAVNAVDPLASIITSVALDHQDLLGDDREAIGREKAGIFRAGRPAICGDEDPPLTLLDRARQLDATLWRIGEEFQPLLRDGSWDLVLPGRRFDGLPWPSLAGAFQFRNAACAIAALDAVASELPVPVDAFHRGLRAARNPGRLERRSSARGVEVVLDVAHNPHAAAALANELGRAVGCTRAVLGVLADKDAVGIVAALEGTIDVWHVAGLDGPRGRSGAALASAIGGAVTAPIVAHPDVATALAAALEASDRGDRVVVLGSFHTVGAALASGLILTPAVDAAGRESRDG